MSIQFEIIEHHWTLDYDIGNGMVKDSSRWTCSRCKIVGYISSSRFLPTSPTCDGKIAMDMIRKIHEL